MKQLPKEIDASYKRYLAASKATRKQHMRQEQAITDHKTALDALAAQVAETEMLLDQYTAGSQVTGKAPVSEATKQVQQTQSAARQQYLQVQINMQRENLVFTSVSNVLKTRHDTAKNSISNVR